MSDERDTTTPLAAERHYSPREIADLWGVSVNTVRRLFQEQPGVLRLVRNRFSDRRTRTLLRIPQSTLDRVHRERSGNWRTEIQPHRHIKVARRAV